MRFRLQLVHEDEATGATVIEDVATFARGELTLDTLGLQLVEAKALLGSVQKAMVAAQVGDFVRQNRTCLTCHSTYVGKGTHTLAFRTLFGRVNLTSPRYYRCACHSQTTTPKSFSPLATCLTGRSAPEFVYLQTKWAALMSYGLTADLLAECFPLDTPLSTAAISDRVQQTADRLDAELGDEQDMFIDGCPRDWEALPEPDPTLTVGIDGGYVRGCEGDNRKAGVFEVIVGKSMPQAGAHKRFGFVNDYDTKRKRRLFELLKAQGMQFNQHILFLSDGGDTVRDIQLYLNPQAEYVLDWFHITMRLTVMQQCSIGLPQQAEGSIDEDDPDAVIYPKIVDIQKSLERIKWYLWHGNVHHALERCEWLEDDVTTVADEHEAFKKLAIKVREFLVYLTANKEYLVNYGDRYHHKETISSAFVESTVNEVISKRFVKKQSMRWTKAGAHRLLQVRTKVLNDEWRQTFSRWYGSPSATTASTSSVITVAQAA